jgi:hypothetical protein
VSGLDLVTGPVVPPETERGVAGDEAVLHRLSQDSAITVQHSIRQVAATDVSPRAERMCWLEIRCQACLDLDAAALAAR